MSACHSRQTQQPFTLQYEHLRIQSGAPIIPFTPFIGSAHARSLPTEGLYKRSRADLEHLGALTTRNTGSLVGIDIDLV